MAYITATYFLERIHPGTLVVNVGEVLKVWSDGIFSSTLHRVINRSGRRRYSIPFFMYPSYDALIQPLMRNPTKH